MTEQAYVTIVDDDDQIRRSMCRTLLTLGCRLFEYASMESLFEALPNMDPARQQCLILDIQLPGIDGLTAQSQLLDRQFDIPIIIVSGIANIPMAVQALRLGASDFIEKPFRRRRLFNAVRSALTEDEFRRERRLLREAFRSRVRLLTEREQEVMNLMLDGKNNKAVARAFDVCPQTAAKHVSRVLEKLEVESTTELISLSSLIRNFGGRQPSIMYVQSEAGS